MALSITPPIDRDSFLLAFGLARLLNRRDVNMTTITKDTLFNGFAMWREILRSIDDLSSANSKFALSAHYFDFDPLFKSRNFRHFPFVFIETDFSSDSVVLDGRFSEFAHMVVIHLTLEKKARSNLRTYADLIAGWVLQNKATLDSTYGIDAVEVVSALPDDFEVDGRQCVRISIEVGFNCDLDVLA